MNKPYRKPTYDIKQYLFTPEEAADYLRISLRTLQTYERKGDISSTRLPSGIRRYTRRALDAFIKKGFDNSVDNLL